MEQQGKTENNGNSRLETGNIWKLMLSLSIPSIIAQLVGILYNMVDRMFIGRIENGTTAMAALSVSLPLITCITAFTRLVGIGGAPLCAIKMGKKDQRGAEEILGVSFASHCGIDPYGGDPGFPKAHFNAFRRRSHHPGHGL